MAAEQTKRASGGNPEIVLRLFVAGNEPNSVLARANLEAIMRANPHLPMRVEALDVWEDFEAAREERVFLTPMLIVDTQPQTRVYGNLNDRDKVAIALGLPLEKQQGPGNVSQA